MNPATLSAYEKLLFRSSERIIGTLDKAFNPQVLQRLSRIILAPSGATVSRRGKIRVRTRESRGGSLAWAVAQRIRAAREKMGLTQEDLAGLTGIARANVARLEAGRLAPRLATVARVAQALSLEAADLLRPAAYKPAKEDTAWRDAGLGEWAGSLDREDLGS
ncbi:MAG: Periplasmic molybdate-binding protein [Elusimicrobia bacterium]|nr:MAG: Periplasmic molybdate-binding protein [Elusimicrobiota bacterium]KAF0158209.1 MAG: Periplasmic molybdate-binding protein [Elusimicrobiota bacterium]